MKLLHAVILTLVAGVATAAVNFENGRLQGQVQEVIDGGAYTYLRIRTKNSGDVWAATLPVKLQKGASVVIADPMLMTDFHSKALNRTFDEIVFGTATAASATSPPAAKAAAPTPAAQTHPTPHGSAAKDQAVAIGKIAKATGAEGRNVVEVYQQSKQLAGKNVQVRGNADFGSGYSYPVLVEKATLK